MESSRSARLEPLSGALAVVLVVVGAVLFGFYTYLPSPADIADHLTENSTRVQIGGYVGVVASFLMVWFAGSVRTLLRRHEGGDSRLGAIAFGGTVSAGVGLALVFGLMIAAGARAGTDSGIGEAEAVTLYDTYASLFTAVLGVGMAALVGSLSIAGLRGGFVRPWVGLVGAVIAIGSISPLAYVFAGLAFLFTFGLSLWAYRTEAHAP